MSSTIRFHLIFLTSEIESCNIHILTIQLTAIFRQNIEYELKTQYASLKQQLFF